MAGELVVRRELGRCDVCEAVMMVGGMGGGACCAITASSGLGPRVFGSDGTGSQHVPLKVAVVALGRIDVGMAELALHIHQGVAAREP